MQGTITEESEANGAMQSVAIQHCLGNGLRMKRGPLVEEPAV